MVSSPPENKTKKLKKERTKERKKEDKGVNSELHWNESMVLRTGVGDGGRKVKDGGGNGWSGEEEVLEKDGGAGKREMVKWKVRRWRRRCQEIFSTAVQDMATNWDKWVCEIQHSNYCTRLGPEGLFSQWNPLGAIRQKSIDR